LKSGRARWARLVTRMREMMNRPTYDIIVENLKGLREVYVSLCGRVY
jgi:hypothetical protein